jgi:hypothetical protein
MLEAMGREDNLALEALDSLQRVYVVELGRPRIGALPSGGLRNSWRNWVENCRDLAGYERLWLAAERRDSYLRGEALLRMLSVSGLPGRARLRAGFLAGRMSADSDFRVSAPAWAALYLLGDRSGVPRLLKALRGGHWPAKYSACRAATLAKIPELAADLAELLGDQSLQVRECALQALMNIRARPGDMGFQPAGSDTARAQAQSLWKKWAGSLTIRVSRERNKKGNE